MNTDTESELDFEEDMRAEARDNMLAEYQEQYRGEYEEYLEQCEKDG